MSFPKLRDTALCGTLLALLLAGGLLGGSSTPLQPVPPAQIRQQTVSIPMRDGIKLAGDLYLPQGDGPFPTLVRKSPYTRERRLAEVRRFSDNGYAVVVVSQRGRFGSEGVFHQSKNEGWLVHQDGYDTIEWAARQPWSNGRIGTYGISSDAQWQLTTAPTRPPHLVAMFASYPAHHRIGGRLERGLHTSSGPTWHYNNQAVGRPLRTLEDYDAWLADWRRTKLPMLATFLHPELVEQFVHTAYDDYWRDIDPATRYQDFKVPLYLEGGWYDRYVRWTFQTFNGIRQQAEDEATRGSQKIIMGPWIHGGDIAPETEVVRFGPAAKIDRIQLQLDWFDHWLKQKKTGIMDQPPVKLYVMGAERWLEADTWPLPNIRYRRYFLTSKGSSGESLNRGGLSPEPPGFEAPDQYWHDPYDPVPTIGGHGGFGRMWTAGPLDQRPSETRTLTYTTDVLDEELTVVGEIRARFFASSSAVDTDFVLSVSDVFPDGYSALLRQNAVRGRYRESQTTETLLEPGKIYEFTLQLDGIANLFKAGHRIRLSIASSSFPAFLPNPGTALPMHLETEGITAFNVIYHDAQHPSSIALPVVSD